MKTIICVGWSFSVGHAKIKNKTKRLIDTIASNNGYRQKWLNNSHSLTYSHSLPSLSFQWPGCSKWKKGLIVRNQTNTLLHQIQTETSPDRYRLVLIIITPEPDQYQKCLLGTRTEPDQNWCTSFIAQHRDKREPESELLHRQFQKSLIRNLNLNVWILFSFK